MHRIIRLSPLILCAVALLLVPPALEARELDGARYAFQLRFDYSSDFVLSDFPYSTARRFYVGSTVQYDRDGDRTESSSGYTAEYVGTLANPFNAALPRHLSISVLGSQSSITLNTISPSATLATDYTHNTNTGNWSVTTDWTPNSPVGGPNAVGDIVRYQGASSITTTQNNGAAVTVGQITLQGANNNSWTITATSGITLNNSGGAIISNTNTNTGTTNFLSLTGGTLTLADNLLVSNTGGNTATAGSIRIGSIIAGTGNITLSNVSNNVALGQIVISGTNTFSGTVLLQKGAVTYNNGSAFGNVAGNTITLGQSGQGSVTLVGTTSGTLPNNIIAASGTTGTTILGSTANTATAHGYSGTILLNGGLTLTSSDTGSNTTSFSGIISGTGGLTKTGAGNVTLSGANTYGGGTTISAGVLLLSGAGTLGATSSTLNLSGTGVLNLNGTNQTVGGIVITAPTSTTTVLTGTGTLTLNGSLSYSSPGNNNFPATLGATTATVLDLGGGTRTFTITGNNNSSGDVIVNALIQNGGINYVGVLGGPSNTTSPIMNFLSANTYSLGTNVSGPAILQLGTSGVVSGGVITSGPVGRGTLTLGTGTTLRSTAATTAGDRTLFNNVSASGSITLGGSTNTGVLTFSSTGLTTPATFALSADTALTTLSGVTINNSVTGSNINLSKAGTGTLTLGGVNTFSGGFTNSAGTTVLNVNGALGSVSSLTVSGGTVFTGFTNMTNAINDSAAVTISGTGSLDLSSGTETVGSLTGASSTANLFIGKYFASSTSTSYNGSFTVGDSNSTTFAGVIQDGSASGTGTTTFNKQGTGILTLSGTNTYTGITNITAGGITITNNAGLGASGANNGTVVSDGAVLGLDGTAANLTIGSELLTLNGAGLAASPAGALRNIAGTNSYAGGITLGSASTITSSAGTLTLTGGITNGGFQLTFDGAGNTTVSGVKITGAGGLTKNGGGTVILSAASDYTGGTTLNAGLLQTNSGTALGSSSGTLTVNGGVLNLADQNISVGNLTGSGGTIWNNLANNAVTLTIGTGNTGGGNYAGVIADRNVGGGTGTGTVALTKTGSGTITLSGANTYTGATIITGGTLQIDNAGSSSARLSGTTNIAVNSGGTLLLSSSSGSSIDRINNAATMTLNGGTFNTGGLSEYTVGSVLPGLGSLTLQASSIIDLANGASILAFANSSGQGWTGTLSIYNWSGTLITGNGTDQLYFGTDATGLTLAQLAQISFYSDSGQTFLGLGAWAPDLDGEVIPLTAVPEPSTWIGAAMALGAALAYSRQHRKRS